MGRVDVCLFVVVGVEEWEGVDGAGGEDGVDVAFAMVEKSSFVVLLWLLD